jgi:hypothetical protein
VLLVAATALALVLPACEGGELDPPRGGEAPDTDAGAVDRSDR